MKPFILAVDTKNEETLNKESFIAKERLFAQKMNLQHKLLDACTMTGELCDDPGF